MLIGDAAVTVDHEGFGPTVDAPVNTDAAIDVRARSRIRIAQFVQPFLGILRLILVIDPMDRDDAVFLEFHEQRMLLAAGGAPGCKYVDQRYLSLEIRAGEPQVAALDRRQVEYRHRFADERRWNLARVQREPDPEYYDQPEKRQQRQISRQL